MTFKEMNLNPAILQAIESQKYTKPTPIQEKAIPAILSGKDLLGCAQTGTGKTAAFAMPILQKIARDNPKAAQNIHGSMKEGQRDAHAVESDALDQNDGEFTPIQALILAPTRELAIQIGESFQTYGQHMTVQTGVVYGGVTPKRHIKVLKRGPQILVATPGRLLDLVGQGHADLTHVKMLVLDEADRMLDLGMIEDVKKIISKLPKARQNMLFSATMPKEVMKLVHSILHNPVKIEVHSKTVGKKSIQQQLYFVDEPDKTALLLHLLKTQPGMESVLVFVRTKTIADKVAKAINIANIRTKALHGDKNQSERMKVMESFKNKEVRVLVATDIAARGIDIDSLSHVVNMNIPNIPETHIHRIGRTGRAGKGGTAITFCSNQEIPFLREVEKLQGRPIKVVDDNPYVPVNIAIARNRERFGK